MSETKHGRNEVINYTPYCLCGKKGQRNDAHDAYACPISFVWLESACSDPKCYDCRNRPETAVGLLLD